MEFFIHPCPTFLFSRYLTSPGRPSHTLGSRVKKKDASGFHARSQFSNTMVTMSSVTEEESDLGCKSLPNMACSLGKLSSGRHLSGMCIIEIELVFPNRLFLFFI